MQNQEMELDTVIELDPHLLDGSWNRVQLGGEGDSSGKRGSDLPQSCGIFVMNRGFPETSLDRRDPRARGAVEWTREV